MLRQRQKYSLSELIQYCENYLNGLFPTLPISIALEYIGDCALCQKDREARKYLIGLLGHSELACRFFALNFLSRIKDLEPGEKVVLDYYKKKYNFNIHLG